MFSCCVYFVVWGEVYFDFLAFSLFFFPYLRLFRPFFCYLLFSSLCSFLLFLFFFLLFYSMQDVAGLWFLPTLLTTISSTLWYVTDTENLTEWVDSIYREVGTCCHGDLKQSRYWRREKIWMIRIADVIVRKLNFCLFFQKRQKLRFLTYTTLVETVRTDWRNWRRGAEWLTSKHPELWRLRPGVTVNRGDPGNPQKHESNVSI